MRIDDILGSILQAGRALTMKDSADTVSTWDSARQVEVVLAVEDALGRDLTVNEVKSLTSIQNIVSLLRSNGVQVEVGS